jgi:peptide/nickel transport system permease protein
MKRIAVKKAGTGSRTQLGLIVFRFKRNKLAIAGLVFLALLMIFILAAPFYAKYDDAIRQDIPHRFEPPNVNHFFGTDAYGRDLFSRIVYGGRISLFAGLATVVSACFVGLALGGVAGYFGGWIDTVIMRIIDILMSVPSLLLAMAICTALGEGTRNMILALVVTDIPRFTRIIRSSILTLRNQEFVEAAKCCGTSNFRIITKHILPNGMGPVIVSATLSLGSAILSIASLGFIGIGIAPPTPEWGTILSDNRSYLRYYPYLGFIPGIMIGLSVMCVNFVGDGLRDALDPRMKK